MGVMSMLIPICHKTYLTKDTEILSREGWCSYEDIVEGGTVLGINANGYLILSNILKKNIRFNVPYEAITLESENFKHQVINGKATILLQNNHIPHELIHVCTGTTRWDQLDIYNHIEDYRLCNFYSDKYEKGWPDLVAEEQDRLNPSSLAKYIRDNYIILSDEILYEEDIYAYFEISKIRCIIPSSYNYLPSEKCREFFKRLLRLQDDWYEDGFSKKVYIINKGLIKSIQEMGIMCGICVSYKPTDIKIPLTQKAIVYEVTFTNRSEPLKSVTLQKKYGTIWSIDTTTKYIVCRQDNFIFMINNSPTSSFRDHKSIRADRFTSIDGNTNLPINIEDVDTDASFKEIKHLLETRETPIYLRYNDNHYQIEKISESSTACAMTLEGENFSITIGKEAILPALNFNDRGNVPIYFRADEIDISTKLKSYVDEDIFYQELHIIKINCTPTKMYSISLMDKDIREITISDGLVILTQR
jgi:hypothetical protein